MENRSSIFFVYLYLCSIIPCAIIFSLNTLSFGALNFHCPSVSILLWACQTFIMSIVIYIKVLLSEFSFALYMILELYYLYPTIAFITSNPFVHIFILIFIIRVNLFTKLAKRIINIVIIARFTQETISWSLNFWSNFSIYFLRLTKFIEAFLTTCCLWLTCIIF